MSLSQDFRQQLATLVQAHDEGCGPVESEAVRRLTMGLPMTALQIRAFAEEAYPTEIRSFLAAQGFHALYERDLGRALASNAGDAPSPTGRGVAVKPRRRDRRTTLSGVALRIGVLAAALGASGLILRAALPTLSRDAAEPTRPTESIVAPPSVSLPPASPCVQSMRDVATAWCESALTGSPVRDVDPETEPAGCGDRLKANSDTVRFALNRILEEDATYTYSYDVARERCAAAAILAAP